MQTMARATIVGRLGADPEVRQTKGGKVWCTFNVATNRSHRVGEEWVKNTDWHKVKLFGKTAEHCADRLRKGQLVTIDGSLVEERWTNKEGQPRSMVRVVGQRVMFMTPRETD